MIFTKDFMVIKIGSTVFFKELSVIFEKNMEAFKTINDLDKQGEETIDTLRKKTDFVFDFHKVELDVETGIKILNVVPATQTLFEGEKTPNLIQI